MSSATHEFHIIEDLIASTTMHLEVSERDDSGHRINVYSASVISNDPDTKIVANGRVLSPHNQSPKSLFHVDWNSLFKQFFLPAGYPATVSPDYFQCQIYYGLQAFCSSLAGLIASRAVLEGHGIGKADASATDAMLLTVLQDAFNRLTTILGAYYLGTSLFPEAKTYRLVADITNDVAIVLDLLSPQLSSYSLSPVYPYIVERPGTGLRVAALCLSAVFRSICGVAAGGSRAAITLHFAQDGAVPGDVGDLSAKDASKETVLALIGMLAGSLMIPYLHTAQTTYTVVFVLLVGHLLANYVAVRVVVMRTLNRQRASILWSAYRETPLGKSYMHAYRRILSPKQVAQKEHIFGHESVLYHTHTAPGRIAGYATIGSPFSAVLPSDSLLTKWIHKGSTSEPSQWLPRLAPIFTNERYMIWLDFKQSWWGRDPVKRIHIFLKDDHKPSDHLKAWLHAADVATWCSWDSVASGNVVEEIKETKEVIEDFYESFVSDLRKAGWDVDAPGLVSGSPKTISVAPTYTIYNLGLAFWEAPQIMQMPSGTPPDRNQIIPFSSIPALPLDIIHCILTNLFDTLTESKFANTLPNCSLVCHDWLRPARQVLFRHIRITGPYITEQFPPDVFGSGEDGFRALLTKCPHIASCIRSLKITGRDDFITGPFTLRRNAVVSTLYCLPNLEELDLFYVRWMEDANDCPADLTTSCIKPLKTLNVVDSHFGAEVTESDSLSEKLVKITYDIRCFSQFISMFSSIAYFEFRGSNPSSTLESMLRRTQMGLAEAFQHALSSMSINPRLQVTGLITWSFDRFVEPIFSSLILNSTSRHSLTTLDISAGCGYGLERPTYQELLYELGCTLKVLKVRSMFSRGNAANVTKLDLSRNERLKELFIDVHLYSSSNDMLSIAIQKITMLKIFCLETFTLSMITSLLGTYRGNDLADPIHLTLRDVDWSSLDNSLARQRNLRLLGFNCSDIEVSPCRN
ncbi:RUS1 family protein [Abortiporus biennis]